MQFSSYRRILIDTYFAYVITLKYLFRKKDIKRQITNKHLLLLAWAFPPEASGGVYRPISIVRVAKKRGWRVTVLCGEYLGPVNSANIHLQQFVDSAATVITVKQTDLNPSHKLFYPKINGGFLNVINSINTAINKLEFDQPSIILASGPPFHNFVVARALSKLFVKPYILDYRDEWTECPFDFVEVGNMDKYYERKCIADAAKIIFNTESHQTHQQQVFNINKPNKTVIISNGWESNDIPDSNTINPLPKTPIRIAFVGNLAEHTLPVKFLDTLSDIINNDRELQNIIRITFVGNKDVVAQDQLSRFKFPKVIESLSFVSKPVALKIMQEADGLLLINEPRLWRYRPGKLYDYIAMRTPILVFGKGGEVDNLVTALNAGVVINSENFSDFVESLSELRKIDMSTKIIDDWLLENTRENLSSKVIDLMEDIEQKI